MGKAAEVLNSGLPFYDSVSAEIEFEGRISDGESLPYIVTVQPTLIVFKPVPSPVPEKPPGALLSTEEAAALLAISPESLRRLCRRKAITFVQIINSEFRFDRKDLDEFIRSRKNRRKSPL
jgi:excisionase family DNA binding protein